MIRHWLSRIGIVAGVFLLFAATGNPAAVESGPIATAQIVGDWGTGHQIALQIRNPGPWPDLQRIADRPRS